MVFRVRLRERSIPVEFFPRLVAHFGPRSIVVSGTAAIAAIYVLFPFENILAHSGGMTAVGWSPIVLQLLSCSASDMGFDDRFGPARGRPDRFGFGFALRLSFSLQNNVMSGYFAYVVLLFLVGVALCVANSTFEGYMEASIGGVIRGKSHANIML